MSRTNRFKILRAYKMWIRFGGHLIDTEKFIAFFARSKRLLGLDKNGKTHLIKKYRNKEELFFAMNILGKKLDSV